MLNPVTSSGVSSLGVKQPANQQASSADDAAKTAAYSREDQRAQLSGQIMQASLDVSIRSGNNSMALLYRTAIEGINAQLEPTLGPNAIQNAMAQDNSPEATAERILSMSTGFYAAYAAQRPNEDPEEVLRDFVDIVRGGFEKGYNEAVDILTGLGVMGEGSFVAEEIGKTFALVHQGYDDFLNAKLQQMREAQGKPADQAIE